MTQTIITLVLAGIVAFAILMYVWLDGFDLGIGILFPFVKDDHERDIMISIILPVWDGNETWLVLGGASLYGAFPVVYSTLLPTLYLPLFLMLIALVFRGVAFEFRHYAKRTRNLWNYCFALGSTIAAFCQGLVLGTFVQGYTTTTGALQSNYHWLSWFSVTTGIAVVCGYVLLGSTWLISKTHEELQAHMYRIAKRFLFIVAAFMALVSLWTPFIDPHIMDKWFSWPNALYLSPLPILSAAAAIMLWFKLRKQQDDQHPFYFVLALFLFAFVGFGISVWPYIIPRTITVWEAAAPLKSQIFILVGLGVVLPFILAYTLYSYKVFKGKVTNGHAIHY